MEVVDTRPDLSDAAAGSIGGEVVNICEALNAYLLKVGGGETGTGGPLELLAQAGCDGSAKTSWVEREYIWGPGDVDECLMQIGRQGERMFVLNDGNNNVVGLTGPTGAMLEQYTYEPYGSLIRAESLATHPVNKLGHQGLFFDHFVASTDGRILVPETTGLYYNRNRHYSPTMGRFLQRDPNQTGQPLLAAMAMNGDTPSLASTAANIAALYGDGMNLYAYVRNNPVNRSDPNGLESMISVVGNIGLQGLISSAMNAAIAAAQGKSWDEIQQSAEVGFLGGALGGMAGAAVNAAIPGAFVCSAGWVARFGGNFASGAANGFVSGASQSWGSGREAEAAFIDGAVTALFAAATQGILGLVLPPGACFVEGTPVATTSGELVPIECIQLGQVVASMPDPALSQQPPEPDVDPATWHEVHLQIDRPDGGCTEAWLLRPPEWLAATGAAAGRTIPVDMSEFGIRGAAHVVDVTPCPPIEKAKGQNEGTVTGRFVTTNALVMSLWIAGLSQPIGCTPAHPFWSEDRATWVAAIDLHPGENVLTQDGRATVNSSIAPPRTATVYNLETHNNHTFFVSDAKLWVHNTCILFRKSTGRTVPANLPERLAMEEAMANPAGGREILKTLHDPTWGEAGWVKMSLRSKTGIEVHWNYNALMDWADDFKFK